MSIESASSILDDESFQTALEYIARLSGPLAQKVLGQPSPIDTLCLFTHSRAEYEFVLAAIQKYGPISDFSHGATTYVQTNVTIADHRITLLGVRQPDPTRPQVGYADYPRDDYQTLLTSLEQYPGAQEITSGRGQSLIELRDPDFDILGYAFNASEH